MSDLIFSFKTTTLTIRRPTAGKWVRGEFRPGKEETFEVVANVQNATPDEVLQVPEGRRGGEQKVVYTEHELQAANESAQLKGDIFEYKGNIYEVHKVEDWSDMTDLPHYKSICLKRDDTKGADNGQ